MRAHFQIEDLKHKLQLFESQKLLSKWLSIINFFDKKIKPTLIRELNKLLKTSIRIITFLLKYFKLELK